MTRGLGAFVVTLTVLCVLGVGADAVVTADAERSASERVGRLLDAPAEVSLTGWPVSVRLLRGHVPEVALRARDVPVGDGEVWLDRLEVDLREVALGFSDLRAEGDFSLRATGGEFIADLDIPAVASLTGLPEDAIELNDGLGRLRLEEGSVEVAAGVEEGQVVLRPVGTAPEGAGPQLMPLPALPAGVVVQDVRVAPGLLRLSGMVSGIVLD